MTQPVTPGRSEAASDITLNSAWPVEAAALQCSTVGQSPGDAPASVGSPRGASRTRRREPAPSEIFHGDGPCTRRSWATDPESESL